jgi:hypothetical protein
MNFRLFLKTILILVFVAAAAQLEAQCPMCKNAVETGMKNGSSVAKGLNTGILYLMALPFVSVATFGFFFWKRTHKKS